MCALTQLHGTKEICLSERMWRNCHSPHLQVAICQQQRRKFCFPEFELGKMQGASRASQGLCVMTVYRLLNGLNPYMTTISP